MDRNMETFLLLTWILAGFVYCQGQLATTPKPSPCNNYVIINNTFLDVSYTAVTNDYSDAAYLTWYRYMNTGQGSLAMTCPTGTQCGTTNQVWVNDTYPSVSDGPRFIRVCYKDGDDCCAKDGTVRVVNCGAFLVYFLIPQNLPNRWCFDNSLYVKLLNTTEEAAGSSLGLIAGAAGGGAVAIGVIGTVGTILFVRLKKKKTNIVDTSEPDSKSVDKDKSPEKPATG